MAAYTLFEQRRNRRIFLLTGILLGGSFFSFFAACLLGPYEIPVLQVCYELFPFFTPSFDVSSAASVIVLDIRLPRAVLAWLTGTALGAAGAVFQGILQNPLADPFTLGVSTGAAFGASLAIFFGVTSLPIWIEAGVLPVAAVLGASVALILVLTLGRAGGRLRRETVVLAGIVVASFLSALVSLLKSLDEESVASIVFWIMGSFSGRGWDHILFVWPAIAIGLVGVIFFAKEIDILCLGDDHAIMLGLSAGRLRLRLLFFASLLTGAAVAVAGVIGFVGLIVPHLIRMVVGAEHRPLVLLSALAGGLGLLWCDVLARIILPEGQELPVGVVTALIGGPFFCILLRKKAKTLKF